MEKELAWIGHALGASSARYVERIQSLWSGYGELFRVELAGGAIPTAVVKWVRPPAVARDRSYERKCRSYEVEREWYRTFAARCDRRCRVARGYASRAERGETLMVLEDLDGAGFAGRRHRPSAEALEAALSWLAAFHARFLGVEPVGLWPVGSYWHLATRPDELARVEDFRLRAAAPWLDDELSRSRFRTLVHGDAKLANFCFTEGEEAVAAVDFQYVGGGCGMRDVAYLLAGDTASEDVERRHLDSYFRALAQRVAELHAEADVAELEREWRALYPVACLDFHRFLAGWARSSWYRGAPLRMRSEALLARLGR